MLARSTRSTGALAGTLLTLAAAAQPVQARLNTTSTSPRLRAAAVRTRESPADQHSIVVGLDLRNRADLEEFLADVQNPASPNLGRFLTLDEFDARYAPAADVEQGVVDYLQANGFTVTDRFSNRLLVGAVGTVAALESALHTEMYNVTFRGEAHYAATNEPTWPAALEGSIVGVIGLDDLTPRHPHIRRTPDVTNPRAAVGNSCCHLGPPDLAVFYNESTGYTGVGETVVIAGVYAWADSDVALFNSQWGLPALPSGSRQVCTASSSGGTPSGCRFSRQNSDEISLDVEYAHATAPGAAIVNYMAASPSSSALTTMYNRIVSDNPGHVVTTSWGACEAETPSAELQINDNIFANANAIGQTWFAASGDSGSRDCGTSLLSVDHPANSPHVMGVGGTQPVCSSGLTVSNPVCGGYGSERGWNDSGGGISQFFARPAFQTGCSVPAGTQRLVPDVALEADPSPGNYIVFQGLWYSIGGTSDAAPQWAGLFAQLNQKSGGSGLGNPGPQLYKLCGSAAFHDITTGSNGDYTAGPGFDMVTGLGSPNAAALLASFGSSTATPTHIGTPPTPTATSTPTPQCGSVAAPKLTIGKLQTPPGDDTLSFQGKLTIPIPFSPPLDPRTNGLQLFIEDTAAQVLAVTIPGDAFSNPPNKGWKVNTAGTKWTYVDETKILIDGINKVVIQNKSATTPGLVTFSVKGKTGSYAVAPADLPVTARIVLAPSGGQCGDASFASCTFNKSGSTLKCK